MDRGRESKAKKKVKESLKTRKLGVWSTLKHLYKSGIQPSCLGCCNNVK